MHERFLPLQPLTLRTRVTMVVLAVLAHPCPQSQDELNSLSVTQQVWHRLGNHRDELLQFPIVH